MKMLWRRKQTEVLPWYRAPDYKGSLTEAEKRKLDTFRSLPRHPSTRYADLPEEVQNYITRLHGEIYDLKQGRAALGAIASNVVGIGWAYFDYASLSLSSFWTWGLGALFFVAPWFVCRHEWAKNDEEFWPDEPASDFDEGIRSEWELNYIAPIHRRNSMT